MCQIESGISYGRHYPNYDDLKSIKFIVEGISYLQKLSKGILPGEDVHGEEGNFGLCI